MRNLLIGAVALCVAGGILLILTITLRAATGGKYSIDYGIVLDAGSSHTEVFLYKWKGDQVNNTGIVEEETSCSTKFGIDDNEQNVSATLPDLMHCVREVTSKIEFGEEDPVPIYLGATAGMRLLEKTKPTITQLIFLAIENALLKYKEEGKQFQVERVGLLSGRQEAVSAWTTANYLSQVFPDIGKNDLTHKKSTGIFEMGGASAQIAYEVENVSPPFTTDDVTSIRLYGKTYNIRAESQLCYGANELLNRYRTLVVELYGSNPSEILDPCFLDETVSKVEGSDFLTPCTQFADPAKQPMKSDVLYIFNGKYDKARCKALVNEMTNSSLCNSKFKICFEEEKISPPADMKFYGLANYFRITLSLRNDLKKASFTENEFEEKTNEFCKKTYKEVEASKIAKMKFAYKYCFMLNFFSAVFANVYKIPKDSFQNIMFVDKVGPESIKWSTGFMLNATNTIPPEMPSSSIISVPLLIVLLIVSVIMIAGGTILAANWKKKKGEQRVSAKERHALNPTSTDHQNNEV